MADALDWAAAPPAAPAPHDTAPAGVREVADVGARTLCAHIGTDYDALDAVTLAHLQGAAWQAFLDMWNAAVEHDLTVAAAHVDQDGQPLTGSEPA